MSTKPDYTNRHKRQNFIRETCHQFVKTKLPDLYEKFRSEAERLFEKQCAERKRA